MSHDAQFWADRLFPPHLVVRDLARQLFEAVRTLPIISPHGHTEPRWFADDVPFEDPAKLFIVPDHYLFRMLYSQGLALEDLGVARGDGGPVETDSRTIWRRFASHYYLFRGTPSRLWLDYVLREVFAIDEPLELATADAIYDHLAQQLQTPAFRPRALFERFNIEVLATTDAATDELIHHRALGDSGWSGRVIPTFRPDAVVDPHYEGFAHHVARLGELTGEDTSRWEGYLRALAVRREYFKALGATATDHGHPSATSADMEPARCQRLLRSALEGTLTPPEAELFRGQMITEMARMSLDDGLVLQLHVGSWRNHNPWVFERFGRDKGADIPTATDYVQALKPLLDRFGNERRLTVILFTLDDSRYARELAPLAGHYPILRLGPPWWFYDSVEGILQFRRQVTETAGFYNTVGFNDDTRAFLSIPARHDMARRVDCRFLAELVAEGRLGENEAFEVAVDLSYRLAKTAYKL
ncbi:MAG: glucuronate isomerase [Candidatus Competibacterales bacterium]